MSLLAESSTQSSVYEISANLPSVFKSFLNNPDDNTDIDYTVSYYEYKNDWLVKDKDGKFAKKVNEKVIPEEIKKISR